MIPARLAMVSLALGCVLPAASPAAEHAPDLGPRCELPITLAVPPGKTREKLPVLTMCRLPEGYQRRIQQVRGGRMDSEPKWLDLVPERALYEHLLARDGDPAAVMVPGDDRSTVAMVTIPADARPVDLIRDGSTFTIRCDALMKPVEHDADATPMPTRQVYAVELGRLPAGAYRCDLSITWREGQDAGSPFFKVARVASGSLPFSVLDTAAPDGPSQPPAMPSLDDGALVGDGSSAAKPGQPMWQIPRCVTRPLADSLADEGLMGVGGVDLTTLGADPIDLPVLVPVDATGATTGTLVAEIVGPTLDSGQWLRVRSVEMALGTWTVTVETWRDNAGRDKNVRHREVLLIPLELPHGGLAQAPRVELRWRSLLSDQPGGSYREILVRNHPAVPHAISASPPSVTADAHGQRQLPPLSNNPVPSTAHPTDHAPIRATAPTESKPPTNDF